MIRTLSALTLLVGCASQVATGGQGSQDNDGGFDGIETGFIAADAIGLQQHGDVVTATFIGQNGSTQAQFDATTSTAATLNDSSTPALAGSLVYSSGALFASFSGMAPSGSGSSSPVTSWVACATFGGQIGTIAAASVGADMFPVGLYTSCDEGVMPTASTVPPPSSLAGHYTCQEFVDAYGMTSTFTYFNGSHEGIGTLVIAGSGGALTAQYEEESGGSVLGVGNIGFAAVSDSAATLATEQSLTMSCLTPTLYDGPTPSQVPQTLPLTAGALTIVGSTVMVSAMGTMGSTSVCPGQLTSVTLVCTPVTP
jgi:hypothetical protein